MSSEHGYTKDVSYYDSADKTATVLKSFIPILGIAYAIRSMIGKGNSEGFWERRKLVDELAKDDDLMFYKFLQNSDDSERFFRYFKEARVPAAPYTGENNDLVTPSTSLMQRTALYEVLNRERATEYFADKFYETPSYNPTFRIPSRPTSPLRTFDLELFPKKESKIDWISESKKISEILEKRTQAYVPPTFSTSKPVVSTEDIMKYIRRDKKDTSNLFDFNKPKPKNNWELPVFNFKFDQWKGGDENDE